MRRLRYWLTVALSVLLIGGAAVASDNVIAPGGGTVSMDNSLTFGVDAGRSRTVNSNSYSVTYAYPSQNGTSGGGTSTGAPDFVPAPGYAQALTGAVCSFSTPVVNGDTAYQYGFTDSGSCSVSSANSPTGVLYAMDLSGARPSTAWSGDVWTFRAADQACKNTPNMAGVGAPTVDTASGYLAIATGCDMYWTSLSNLQPRTPTEAASASGSGWSVQKIQEGSSAQAGNLVAESPVITQPLTVNYTVAGQPVQESTPFVCAGDWNEGMACKAMVSVAGETAPAAVNWTIPTSCTQSDGPRQYPITWVGGCLALDNGGHAILTSSPSWDPQASVGGSSGAVVFGINDGNSGPGAVVELDPVTGASRIIVLKAGYDGLTGNAAGISSSVAVYEYGTGAPPNGTMIVPDNYGDLYELSPSGQLLASMTDPSIANRSSCTSLPWDISDVAVGQYSVYAVEDCLTTLWRFGASNLAQVGSYDLLPGQSQTSGGSAYTTGAPTGMYSPTVVRVPNNPKDAYLFLNAQAQSLTGGGEAGLLYVVPIGSSVQASGSVAPISTTTGSPPYVAALPDAGSLHDVLLWSNADSGGFDYWQPTAYQNESLGLGIESGGSTLTSVTVPAGSTVTFDMLANLPSLGHCDSNTTISPNMTCLNLWMVSNGQSSIVASDEDTLVPQPPYLISLVSSGSTGATWTTQVTFNQPGTYSLYAILKNTAPNWPGGVDPVQAQVQSANVTVTVKATSTTTPGPSPSCATPSSTGWNKPPNCVGGLPTPPPAQVSGTLAMAVGDLGSSYSPVYDPNWSPNMGPDPCITPSTTCNSPYMAFLPTQYGLFGQHLLVQVTPPPYASQPPDRSSPPQGYTPGVCKVYFPESTADYVALPRGIAEETGQRWTREWDPLKQAAGGAGLTGQVLVDWAWWPPLPTGTVSGPRNLVSHWVADVYKWIYQRVQVGTTSGGSPIYQWQASCVDQGLENGSTNPAVNPAQGGQVYVWGDRIVLIPETVKDLVWGLP